MDEQPVPVELVGQARKPAKKHRYNKIYCQNIVLEDNDFLTTGVHKFKFRTFRLK